MDPARPAEYRSIQTPQRSRGRTCPLYPSELAKDSDGRVPLHRRGTSRTYERLEDLLREAGYKETRVFTPEADRFNADGSPKKQARSSTAVAGVSAVLNYVAGLVSWNDQAGSATTATRTQSLGRATAKGEPIRRRIDEDLWTPTSPSPRLPQRKPYSPIFVSSDFASGGASGNISSSTSSPRSPPKRMPVHRSRDARTTLRHMMSAPDFPKRPSSVAPERRTLTEQNAPPMPANWLHTVARAVLGTSPSSGAYIGGPTADRGRASGHAHNHMTRTPTSRPRKSRREASTVSSRKLFAPHQQRVASTPCTGTTTTSVVCRSAPGSRSSSHVRTKKGRRVDSIARLPSLGATAIESETWAVTALQKTPTPGSSNASTSNASTSSLLVRLDSEPEEDSDSDVGELDLSQILVPPRRQQSIRSLRKHLNSAVVAESASSGGASALPRSSSARNRDPTNMLVRSTLRDSHNTASLRVRVATASIHPDDSFEADLERDMRRSRRGSIDEVGEDGLGEWAPHGLPGLRKGNTAIRKRGSVPWTAWTQGRP